MEARVGKTPLVFSGHRVATSKPVFGKILSNGKTIEENYITHT